MSTKAFALREDRKESFSDAAISIGGGRNLRVGELLKDGGGVIVTDDPHEQNALAQVAALKQVEVPKKRASKKNETDTAGGAGGKE